MADDGTQPRTLVTRHGTVALPAFLPDATRAVVRTLDSHDIHSSGVQGLIVNTFHLINHPGVSVLKAMGGVHGFMNWGGTVVADSGGFQIFSLLSQDPKMGSITSKGFAYRLERGGAKKVLTAEKSVIKQVQMGADVIACLDHCTHPDGSLLEQRQSVDNTIRWARSGREALSRHLPPDGGAPNPLLVAFVQGGGSEELRRRCAGELVEMGFQTFGFGGWPVTDDGLLQEMVQLVAEALPSPSLTWAAGIGKPEHVVRCAELGYDLFDCTIPTRDARHMRLYVFREPPQSASLKGRDFYSCLYMQDKKHVRSAEAVDSTCDCLCCRSYSRAYLHHLFSIRDATAHRLATLHNVRFYTRLLEEVRRRSQETSCRR